MVTRTGQFPIGFRRGGGEWQKDLPKLCRWAREQGFEALDISRCTADDVRAVQQAGLRIGTVDLLDLRGLLSPDAAKRRDAVARNTDFMRNMAGAGAKLFFVVIVPEAPDRPRLENYKLAVESYAQLGAAAEKLGARILIEGYPGGGLLPHLCCNPETCRALFKDAGAPALGINYDPSHLIRMGIDHLRFAEEFGARVGHVHAKDTELIGEAAYEYGLYQPSVFNKAHGYGSFVWRYTLPGHGCARWTRLFQILKSAGFGGIVSVELEDENFNGTEAGEKSGLLASLAFLKSA